MRIISSLCAGFILWVMLSFFEINMQNKMPAPEYVQDNAFVLLGG